MKSFIPLIRSEWQLLLFGFLMMFFSSPGQTYFIALFSGEIRAELDLSHGEFGAVYSAATLASALILLWSGTLLDRIALPKFSISLVAGLALACVVMANSTGVITLFLAILMLRHLGQGLMTMTGSTSMMRYVAHSKGKANSLTTMGYSTAEAVLPTVVIAMLLVFSWRQSWLVFAAVLVVCVPLAIYYLLHDQPTRHRRYLELLGNDMSDQQGGNSLPSAPPNGDASLRQWTRAEVIRDPLFYLFVPGILSQSMLFTGFMFHQIHMVEEKGWSLPVWGSLYLLFSVSSICANLTIGAWIDRIGAVRLAPFVTVPMAIGLLILSGSDSLLAAALFMVGMAVSTGGQAAITSPFFSERYGNRYLGSIKSLGTFTMVLLSAVSPVLMGWFIDRGVSIDALAVGAAGYAALVTCLAYLAYRLSIPQG